MARRGWEPEISLPPSHVDRWSYVARFSAYQGEATAALLFFDETQSRRSKSSFIYIPTRLAFPESPQEVQEALSELILDWGVGLGSSCHNPKK